MLKNQQYKFPVSNFERFTSEKSIQFCIDKTFQFIETHMISDLRIIAKSNKKISDLSDDEIIYL